MDPKKYTGRAAYQVEQYLKGTVRPMLEKNARELGVTAQINV
jgi:adenylosuccinate lyase